MTNLQKFDFDSDLNRTGTASLKWEKYAGRPVLPFWVADMDFRSPEPVIQALHERVEHGVFGYTIPPASCTEAVLDYLRDQHGLQAGEDWLLWTPGLVPAINLACRAFAQPGDAVMTLTPVYYPFISAPEYAGQELLAVPLVLNEASASWEIDFDEMERRVHARTRMLIISNPHNPVGKVFSRQEMEALASFVIRHDLILCSDEIHCDLILNDKRHCCAGSLGEELLNRLILMFAPSKTYNLAGLSCAYVVIPNSKLRHRFKQAIRGIITEVNCMGYTGCEVAYRMGGPWLKALIAYLEENRALLYDAVHLEMPGVQVYPMDATYLAWLDVRELQLEQPAAHFEKFGIGLSDGATFGGQGFVRLNFGCPRLRLEEGISRMIEALKV